MELGRRGLRSQVLAPLASPFPSLSSSFHLEDALTAIGEKVCVEVSSRLSLCGFSPLTADQETALKGQIQAVASPDDPVRRIVGMFGGRQGAGLCPQVGWQAGPLKKSGRVLMGRSADE